LHEGKATKALDKGKATKALHKDTGARTLGDEKVSTA
jgi:hypothetical protein